MLRRRSATREVLCAYCRATFAADDATSTCVCGVLTHPECRAELGRCPTIGCQGAPVVAPPSLATAAGRSQRGERELSGYPAATSLRGGVTGWIVIPLVFLAWSVGPALLYLIDPPWHARPGPPTWGAATLALLLAAGCYGRWLPHGLRQLRRDRAWWRGLGVESGSTWPALPWEGAWAHAGNATFPALPQVLSVAVALCTLPALPMLGLPPEGDGWVLAVALAAGWALALALRAYGAWRGPARVGFDPAPLATGRAARLEVELPRGFGRRGPLRCTLRCLIERSQPAPHDPELTETTVAVRWSHAETLPRPAEGPLVLQLELPPDAPGTSPEAFIPGGPRQELVRWELEVQESDRQGWGYLFSLPVLAPGAWRAEPGPG